MIKLIKIEAQTPDRSICTLFADTKTEVPQTGSATMTTPKLEAGSVIYTASGDLGFLKSNDQWNWVEAGSGGGGSSPTDLSAYRTAAAQDLIDGTQNTAIATKESTGNKVTTLSASSTNTQYPSAKCVYDAIIGAIEEAY